MYLLLHHAELSPSNRGGAGLAVHALCVAYYDARRTTFLHCRWDLLVAYTGRIVGMWYINLIDSVCVRALVIPRDSGWEVITAWGCIASVAVSPSPHPFSLPLEAILPSPTNKSHLHVNPAVTLFREPGALW